MRPSSHAFAQDSGWRTVHTWCCNTPDEQQYVYLLAQYLGDGHLTTSVKVPVLRIACTDCYPGIIEECRQAMLVTLARSVQIVPQTGCVHVQSYSTHWPCLFPQHGPGPKHRRPIVLAGRQQELVDAHPRPFLRGLIHSDGCRTTNRVTVRGKQYSYPRCFFSNKSLDILKMCGGALDRVGAVWRYSRWDSLSVATNGSVALLDGFIGVKG